MIRLRRTQLTLALACLVATVHARQAPVTTSPPSGSTLLSLTWIISQVLSNNPTLQAAGANWQAMGRRVPQARAWEDPRASFDQRVARFVGVPPNSFADERLMVEQTLPVSGRNRLRADAATAEAASAFEELRRKQLDAVSRARAAFFRLANAAKQLELNRKNSDLLKQFAEISHARMAAGNNSQGDALSADTELARLDEAQFDFQRQISDASTELNVLMNRPPEAALLPPPDLTFEPVDLSLPNLEALVLANRPELAMAQRKLEAARARLNAAQKEWIPEPSLRLEADRYNDASQIVSELDAGFSIDLPWFNRSKYRAAIRENESLVQAAHHELDAARSEALGLVVDQFHRVETFHHHTELYQAKLLPLARQTVAARRSAYEADKASFLEVLTAEQTARDAESMYWDHLMHYNEALAELEGIIGVDLAAPAHSTSDHHHQHMQDGDHNNE